MFFKSAVYGTLGYVCLQLAEIQKNRKAGSKDKDEVATATRHYWLDCFIGCLLGILAVLEFVSQCFA